MKKLEISVYEDDALKVEAFFDKVNAVYEVIGTGLGSVEYQLKLTTSQYNDFKLLNIRADILWERNADEATPEDVEWMLD